MRDIGKSIRDLDMFLRIAETLDTDANTALYGIPPTRANRRLQKRLYITGALFLGLRPIAWELSHWRYIHWLSCFLRWLLVLTLWTLGGF